MGNVFFSLVDTSSLWFSLCISAAHFGYIALLGWHLYFYVFSRIGSWWSGLTRFQSSTSSPHLPMYCYGSVCLVYDARPVLFSCVSWLVWRNFLYSKSRAEEFDWRSHRKLQVVFMVQKLQTLVHLVWTEISSFGWTKFWCLGVDHGSRHLSQLELRLGSNWKVQKSKQIEVGVKTPWETLLLSTQFMIGVHRLRDFHTSLLGSRGETTFTEFTLSTSKEVHAVWAGLDILSINATLEHPESLAHPYTYSTTTQIASLQTDTAQSSHSPCTLCLPALPDNCHQIKLLQKEFHPHCNKHSEK